LTSRQQKLETLTQLEALAEEKKRRVKSRRLESFKPYPFQRDFCNASGDASQVLLMAANRVGKAVRSSEPVLTPRGWVPIKDLSVGDVVCDPQGGHAPVTGVFPQGLRDVYRVHFNDGTYADCDLDHQWRCKSPEERFRKRYTKKLASGEVRNWDNPGYGQWQVKTLREIIDDVGLEPSAPRRYAIPVVERIDYEERSYPIDPYTLGVLLGDGSLQQSCILHSADEEQFDLIKLGPHSREVRKNGLITRSYVGMTGRLRDAGVFGLGCHEKYVPSEYKHSNERLAVLQGLMDTDGHASGHRCEFVSVSRQLAQDVADICRSLGIRCSIKSKKTTWTYGGELKRGVAWRVGIWATDVPLFRLSRKASAYSYGQKKNGSDNVIVRIEPLDKQDEMVCISVDSPTNTYVISDYIVTHNTFTGAANIAFQATGLYPDWWEGKKWEGPIDIWVSGVSAESTRDILQAELLGPPDNPDERGTGMIPHHCIGDVVRKPQVPNALQSALVRHHTDGKFDGWSRITFKAFEQGEAKFMGRGIHEIWLDEQPPDGLFTQCATRTATTGGTVSMTFTPEDGMTQVVSQFMNDIKPGQKLIGATWDDAPHITDKVKSQLLEIYGEHERDMRSKGIPLFGSGPVFPVPESEIIVDPFEIPEYWPGIAGLDFGWDHPTAVVWLRWDRDSDCVYVVDEYRHRKETIAFHATAIRARETVPVVWPHDGMKHEGGSGVSMADQYRMHGIKMLPQHFTNPLAIGDGKKGNYKVEPGINALLERMQTGRFKVFKTCREWFEEYRLYHREDGKIVALNDDLMSATRYAAQSLRFAEVPTAAGAFQSRFGRKLKYEPTAYLA